MRKHKSVVAILLAVMMIFTFMPTMAFATDFDYAPTQTYGDHTAVWSNNFKTVTIDGTTTYDATVSQVSTGTNNHGLMVARVFIDGNVEYQAYFYDLSNAVLYNVNNKALSGYVSWDQYAINYAEANGGSYDSSGNNKVTVRLVKPDYLTSTDWTEPVTVNDEFNKFGYSFTVKGEAVARTFSRQQVTVEATGMRITDEANGSQWRPFVVGSTNPSATFTVDDNDSSLMDTYYIDQVDEKHLIPNAGANYGEIAYTGKTQTVIAAPISGMTLSYKVYDESKSVWKDATSPITVKNVGDEVLVKAIYTNARGVETPALSQYVTVVVATDGDDEYVYNPTFKFTGANKFSQAGNYYEITAAQAADPASLVVVTGMAADDEAELMKYFADRYEVKVAQSKLANDVQTWTIAEKASYNETAVKKTYKTLLANYGATGFDALNTGATADPGINVKVVDGAIANDKADDVTFTKAQGQKYSYKKVLKKKSKSFTVKAVADSGKAVNYSIVSSNTNKIKINATSGKITVKKGLKKGTYTLTIKAKTVAGEGYKAASDKATIKVKVTK